MLTVVGDPHVKLNNLDKIEKLFEIVEDLGNTTVWLGDMLDTKEVIRGKCLNLLYRRFSESKLNHIVLVGNHDWFNLECEEHSLEVLKSLPNVEVVDEPKVIDKMFFVPYMNNTDVFKTIMKRPMKGVNVAFIHQGVVGFDYGNGFVADGNGHGEVESEALAGWKRVISGHFHKYAEAGNLTFIGTPFTHSFGESGKKHIALYDPKKDQFEFLETPFPKHFTITISFKNDPKPQKILEEMVEDFKKEYKTNEYLRVNLVGPTVILNQIDKSKFPLVKFIEKPTDTEASQNSVISEEDSNIQKFYKWATEIKGLDEDTITLGLEILGDSE